MNSSVPIQVGSSTSWSRVAAGGANSAAVRTDGTLWAWGYNYYGALGDGTNVTKNSPVQIGLDNTWQSIIIDTKFSAGIKTDRSFCASGRNSSGQLNTGNTSSTNIYTCSTISRLRTEEINGIDVIENTMQIYPKLSSTNKCNRMI